MNTGHFSRLDYDTCFYPEKVLESVGPGNHQLNPIARYNCNNCLSTLGPRASLMGNQVSTIVGSPVAAAQQLIDVDSIFKNLNVPQSKCRNGKVNPINLANTREFPVANNPVCNKFLDPMASRLTLPAANYRSMSINTFFDLDRNIQEPIYYPDAKNTRLEQKDNYFPLIDVPNVNTALPTPRRGSGPKPLRQPANNCYKGNCNK